MCNVAPVIRPSSERRGASPSLCSNWFELPKASSHRSATLLQLERIEPITSLSYLSLAPSNSTDLSCSIDLACSMASDVESRRSYLYRKSDTETVRLKMTHNILCWTLNDRT